VAEVNLLILKVNRGEIKIKLYFDSNDSCYNCFLGRE
jgi:hypothetical protein